MGPALFGRRQCRSALPAQHPPRTDPHPLRQDDDEPNMDFATFLAVQRRRLPPAAAPSDVSQLKHKLQSGLDMLAAERRYSQQVDEQVEELTARLLDLEVQQQVGVLEFVVVGALGGSWACMGASPIECLLVFLAPLRSCASTSSLLTGAAGHAGRGTPALRRPAGEARGLASC